jgi:hypothetical protein
MTHNLKKIILLAISIFMVSAVFAKPVNPIPSFKFLLKNKDYFQETNLAINNFVLRPEKRDMNISNDTPGNKPNGLGGSDGITVYVYRLDQSIILGPFIVHSGETLSVPIDGHLWGVFADSHHQTVISVWINNDL